MKNAKQKRFSASELLKKGVPAILIPGILLAVALGWSGGRLRTKQYTDITEVFPYQATVMTVIDGDTFQLTTGQSVRLLGINAPDRGDPNYAQAKQELETLIANKTVYLEYDRYQDDKYGRILGWVWINCEGKPTFLPFDYMHESNNASKPGLVTNPEHCEKGILVNEALAKAGYAEFVTYKDRGELKYQQRIEGKNFR